MRAINLSLAGILAAAVSLVHAGQEADKEFKEHKELKGQDLNGRGLQELYAGVVVDQTVTVVGHEFYQHFAALWREKEMANRYAISVHERPTARWGSQIWVEYAQRRVFQVFMPAARGNVKAVSEQAAETAFRNVVDSEVQRLLFREPDLGADEI